MASKKEKREKMIKVVTILVLASFLLGLFPALATLL